MTSMLPVITLEVFGLKRGNEVYGYMFSVFGVAAMSGTLFVGTIQSSIGYQGMLLLCLACSITAGLIALPYKFERVSYLKTFNQN